MDGPLAGPDGAQTINREVDTLTDAHAGMTDKQQNITGEVVAAQQFLLDQLILFRGQRARQTVIPSGNIIGDEQVVSRLQADSRRCGHRNREGTAGARKHQHMPTPTMTPSGGLLTGSAVTNSDNASTAGKESSIMW